MAYRILIVDDQEDVRSLLYSLLTMKGYEVIEAKDGMQAVAEVNKYRPDLMILDVSMPRMSGFQTCQMIRKIRGCETLPVMFLTAKKSEADKKFADRIGGNVYLTKPFNPNELLFHVSELLQSYAPPDSATDRPTIEATGKTDWQD